MMSKDHFSDIENEWSVELIKKRQNAYFDYLLTLDSLNVRLKTIQADLDAAKIPKQFRVISQALVWIEEELSYRGDSRDEVVSISEKLETAANDDFVSAQCKLLRKIPDVTWTSYGLFVARQSKPKELEWLLVKSSLTKAQQWEPPKGNGGNHEDPKATANRECHEEAGIVGNFAEIEKDFENIVYWSYFSGEKKIRRCVTYFLAWLGESAQMPKSGKETSAASWVSDKETEELLKDRRNLVHVLKQARVHVLPKLK